MRGRWMKNSSLKQQLDAQTYASLCSRRHCIKWQSNSEKGKQSVARTTFATRTLLRSSPCPTTKLAADYYLREQIEL